MPGGEQPSAHTPLSQTSLSPRQIGMCVHRKPRLSPPLYSEQVRTYGRRTISEACRLGVGARCGELRGGSLPLLCNQTGGLLCITASYKHRIVFCWDTFDKLIFEHFTANKSRNDSLLQMHVDPVVCVKEKVWNVHHLDWLYFLLFPFWVRFYGACSQLRHTVVNWPGPFSNSSLPPSGLKI